MKYIYEKDQLSTNNTAINLVRMNVKFPMFLFLFDLEFDNDLEIYIGSVAHNELYITRFTKRFIYYILNHCFPNKDVTFLVK